MQSFPIPCLGLVYLWFHIHKLMRTDRTVLADLRVDALTDTECSRCLIDTVLPLSLDFAEEFKPINTDLVSGHRDWFDEHWALESDDALTIAATNVLDISTALWQGLSAAMPMNPLCDAKCRGMCADCSADLNLDACRC